MPHRGSATTARTVSGSTFPTRSTSAGSTRASRSTSSIASTADTAEGRVTFPVVYEGPPGLVHGGFLAVFFDCVIQHQNCATELSGKTRSLTVKFRRPTPILTELTFDIVREQVGQGCDVDGAAVAGRRGAVHRRSHDTGPFAGQAHRVQLRQATDLTSWSCRVSASRAWPRSSPRGSATRSSPAGLTELPSQESLFQQFGVSPPALREAIHILETDGLISVRRGNVGGAVVHLPSAARTAQMIAMVLQTRDSTPADVSEALLHLEPICAGMCASRDDRMTEVVPYLQAEIDRQTEQFDDVSAYVPNARRFHEALVSRCGNEPMILLIGSLELIWSAHESSVWSDDDVNHKTMRAALRDHQRLLDAVRDGNATRAVRLAQDHLAAARRNTLAVGTDKTIEAKLISRSSGR